MRLTLQHHNLLNRLTTGPKDIKFFSHGDTHSHLGHHYSRWLPDLQLHGYVVEIDEKWHITNAGRKALENKYKPQSSKIGNGTTHEIYDGKELSVRIDRPGAYDFLNHPSLYSGIRVMPKRA
jgi:hypothetical protein